jgi:hypothetical protein
MRLACLVHQPHQFSEEVKMKFGTFALAALGLGLTANAALALPSVEGAFTNGFQQWSDNSGELVYDASGNVVSTLAVGNIFAGVVQISSFPTTNANASSYNQLTAIFALKIDTITPVPGSVCHNVAITSCSTITFSSDGSSLGALLAIAEGNSTNPLYGLTIGAGLTTANTIAAFYEGNGNSGAFIDGGTDGSDALQASSGTLRLVASDDGLLSNTPGHDNWSGNGPTTLAQLALNPPVQGAGDFSFSETITSNYFPGLVLSPMITGQGTISFNADNPFGVTDNTSFGVFITRVPEPVTLSLFGAGLIGAAAIKRRKVKRA